MSVIAHSAIIAAGTIAASASAATEPDRPVGVPITYVEVNPPEARPQSTTDAGRRGGTHAPVIPKVPDMVIVDRWPELPLPWPGSMFDSVLANPGLPGGSAPGSSPDSGAPGPASERVHFDFQVERAAALRTRIEPRYPPVLRAAGIEGDVIARFIIDTTGRVEPGSVRILRSSHDQFSEAVRAVLARMRFEPARVGRGKVRQLVDLPFAFALMR